MDMLSVKANILLFAKYFKGTDITKIKWKKRNTYHPNFLFRNSIFPNIYRSNLVQNLISSLDYISTISYLVTDKD